MGNKYKKSKSNWIYVLGALYVVAAYTFIFLAAYISEIGLNEKSGVISQWIIWLWPIILGIVNLAAMLITGKKCDRNQLLNCVILIKYGMIPFYIIGGGCVFLFLVFSFIPVPFMIFVGPYMAMVLCICGWLIMVGTAPITLAYIIKSYKEGLHGIISSVIAGVAQFFFIFDVLSIMVMAVKEGRWKKLTITIIILVLILCSTLILGGVMLLRGV
ncbi:ABC transporter permease [Bariatricus massiliensis]|uniref:ABC transporter permease n=1 Tax=Bariatricus massiliensis TaxID=1745713 RepID=A0ABS8DJX4_9FIRM|nr:hypothetical protein [Bariatricus massiliensis]MCB7305609.1 ABC transporter permease [Bariatricus massiliensis]MCB7376163.1 ABC transporter permease [Bariatricus massiliensis]MCB7388723.1 ABC transporter permease [Bariatricus massiliensis]MCB7412896.1 ABC transporter permease [Bariatricus massiliensis]MCQ5253202.1 ABC transporter permease [Bariatricus massiliensis]